MDMSKNPSVRLGTKNIGLDHPVYVIAEAGVNHNGSVTTALALVEAAACAGADAVKFQFFVADRLASPDAPTCRYQKEHHAGASSQLQMLQKLELRPDDFEKLKTHADKFGIDFLCTPFGIPEVDMLARIPVAAIKLASPDIVNVPLLRAAISTGLPLIASTGAADLHEVQAAFDLFAANRAADRLALLHCVSAYPTPISETRLACINSLSREFRIPVGFSDHTTDVDISALAVAAGASILEKHLTLDRSSPGPDHFFSLTPDDLARYVATARSAFAARGSGQIAPSANEREVRSLARSSIIAARDIPAGTTIRADYLTTRRPGTGISPLEWDNLLGTVATTDISANSCIMWTQVRSAGSTRTNQATMKS